MNEHLGDKIGAHLRLVFKDRKTASSINDALLPDNIDIPEGITILQKFHGDSILIVVEAEDSSLLETLISTLDEFVSHVHSACQTLSRIDSIGNDRHKDSEGKFRKGKGKPRKAKYN